MIVDMGFKNILWCLGYNKCILIVEDMEKRRVEEEEKTFLLPIHHY